MDVQCPFPPFYQAPVLNQLPVGVAVIDSEYTVLFFNKCLSSWTGYAYGEVVGKNIRDLFPHLHDGYLAARFETVFQGGPPAIFSAQIHGSLFPSREKQPRDRLQHVTVSGLRRDDDYLAMICVEDVTEVYRRLKAYSEMRDRAVRELGERRRAEQALRESEEKLRILATIDDLTGLLNRRQFIELAARALKQSRRYGHALSLMIIDVDHFKEINDTYGHQTGDDALSGLARVFQETFRQVDVIGRIGGEEFACALPETNLNGAICVAERLRASIVDLPLLTVKGSLSVTISIGVAELDDADENFEALYSRSDRALYKAKNNGRNRVESDEYESPRMSDGT
ncbi:sensor domain-containing diguanylate cyclase [Desulfovibrio inopinatus]|uniref:sensor domain-containing diguanylate cyclase n=1 Tax=Desulfovibrio inopinatus TaxID=102109 RepID=UPI00041D6F4B|nr:sensor domain-containing diguanylate cyclase [Desulfovibrio inopinatus]